MLSCIHSLKNESCTRELLCEMSDVGLHVSVVQSWTRAVPVTRNVAESVNTNRRGWPISRWWDDRKEKASYSTTIANKNFVSYEKVKARIVISDIENCVCYELLEWAPRNGNGSWWTFADKCYCDMNLKANEEFSLQNFHWGRKLGA